ncbi:acetylserotonin O-methyltransferase-like [Saccoglossus kowalevskii]|uniref:Acetylserotonin O-methyltransferase n=1 Tax=Saccoglossus kowalevskii TaxID=10224 RepID=A0A0U2UYZ5_SACKO|nr:PREDICTED: acetylserotonin O-methyltransferase-like [Saccoglossus kowalevskii]ALR88563.1 n-acetylserotonin o-methyltransferase-like 116 [Saccoglossus kowalevskii]
MAYSVNDPVQILAHVHSYAITQALVGACHLRLFDHMENAGIASKQLAENLYADPEAMEELLNALVSLGYVEKINAGNRTVQYRNTPISSTYLVTTSAQSLYPYIMIQGQVAYPVQANFRHAVQEGKAQVERTFGHARYFTNILANDQKKAMGFFASMHALSRVFHCPVALESFDLSAYREVCELGGGTGMVALALAQTYSTMNITVFDLPPAIEAADKFIPLSSKPENLRFQKGDLMRDSLPYCDLYVLSHIIHTYSEDQASYILKQVYASLSPGGAVLILENLYNDDKRGPQFTHMFSLSMLAFSGTRQRSFPELKYLLERQGFKNIEAKRTGSLSDAVLALKPALH